PPAGTVSFRTARRSPDGERDGDWSGGDPAACCARRRRRHGGRRSCDARRRLSCPSTPVRAAPARGTRSASSRREDRAGRRRGGRRRLPHAAVRLREPAPVGHRDRRGRGARGHPGGCGVGDPLVPGREEPEDAPGPEAAAETTLPPPTTTTTAPPPTTAATVPPENAATAAAFVEGWNSIAAQYGYHHLTIGGDALPISVAP